MAKRSTDKDLKLFVEKNLHHGPSMHIRQSETQETGSGFPARLSSILQMSARAVSHSERNQRPYDYVEKTEFHAEFSDRGLDSICLEFLPLFRKS